MKYFNENEQEFNIEEFKKELKNLEGLPVPSEEEILSELEDSYEQGQKSMGFTANFSVAGLGTGIWARIKNILCSVLHAGSTEDEIIDAVIDAVLTVLPGGFIVKKLIKKLVKYILNRGVVAICPI